ncbi:unnamed protein product, partial [Prorocentrum cordatum]
MLRLAPGQPGYCELVLLLAELDRAAGQFWLLRGIAEAANHVYEGLVRAEWAGLSDLERIVYLAQAQQEAEAKERARVLEADAKGRARLLEVDPEAETVPGLPGLPAESAMTPGRVPAEPAAVPVPPPPVFGAFLNAAALPSGDAACSEGPLSSLLAAAAARTLPSHPGVCNSAYSPALLAAVGLLPAETLAGWLAHASMGPPFAGLVQELVGASAAPSSDHVFALQSLAAAAPGHAAPAALAAAALLGRLARPVGLAEVVHTLLLGANYLDPLVAEALAAVYGGSAQGAAAALRAASLRWAAGAAGGSSSGSAGASLGLAPASQAQHQPQQPPAPSGSSRRYAGADPGSARFRRGLPARADGRALTEQEVLQLAAACGLYTDSRQAFWLFGTSGARIGLALRPLGGGGVINFWLRQAKLTIAGNTEVRERLLEAVLAWT